MHYLLSVAPGNYYVDGKLTRVMAGESITVEPEKLQEVLNQYSFLKLVASDPETVIEEVDLAEPHLPISTVDAVGGADKVADPEAVLPIGNVSALVYSKLAADASAAEAITYLQELANLDPIPVELVTTVAQMYPKSAKVTGLAAKILNSLDASLVGQAGSLL